MIQNILRHIINFFRPERTTYAFSFPTDTVTTALHDFFNEKKQLLDTRLAEGRFINSDTFEMERYSPVYKWPQFIGSPKLTGEIIAQEQDKTLVKLKIRGSVLLYLLFGLSIIISVAYLINTLANRDYTYIYLQLLLLIVVPALIIWFSGISNYAIRENFLQLMKQRLQHPHK